MTRPSNDDICKRILAAEASALENIELMMKGRNIVVLAERTARKKSPLSKAEKADLLNKHDVGNMKSSVSGDIRHLHDIARAQRIASTGALVEILANEWEKREEIVKNLDDPEDAKKQMLAETIVVMGAISHALGLSNQVSALRSKRNTALART